jgi:hypothetical protein
MITQMFGYKGFNSDWSCKNFNYEIGKKYQMSDFEIELGHRGFHFCQFSHDVLIYYNQPNSKYAKIKASGRIILGLSSCVTSEITIIEEITKDQLLDCMDGFYQRIDGTKEWWQKGKLHRDSDLPAIEYADGQKEWLKNGQHHRLHQPSVICQNGAKLWHLNGQLHRNDGPAVEDYNGNCQWYQNGKLLQFILV